MKHIIAVAKETVNREEDYIVRREYQSSFTHCKDELLKTGWYFPNKPAIAQISDVLLNNSDVGEHCNKAYKASGYLGAGVVLFWCIRHRECIGFIVLQKAESCQVIYDMMSTRLNVQPKIFIYDNACNLFEVGN